MAELKEQTIEKEFVPYDLALELKELGFDEECLDYYIPNSKAISEILDSDFKIGRYNSDTNNIYGKRGLVSRPLWQQAFRFFREKYGLHYIICKNIQMDGYGYREVILSPYMEENENTIFKTYEEAEVECLVKLIEIAKEQNVK